MLSEYAEAANTISALMEVNVENKQKAYFDRGD